jgi:hypothetical protein
MITGRFSGRRPGGRAGEEVVTEAAKLKLAEEVLTEAANSKLVEEVLIVDADSELAPTEVYANRQAIGTTISTNYTSKGVWCAIGNLCQPLGFMPLQSLVLYKYNNSQRPVDFCATFSIASTAHLLFSHHCSSIVTRFQFQKYVELQLRGERTSCRTASFGHEGSWSTPERAHQNRKGYVMHRVIYNRTKIVTVTVPVSPELSIRMERRRTRIDEY